MAYAQGLATLQQRHPDLQEVVGSEKFKEWVQSSSARMARYQKADQMGDVEEADDLISTFKQLNQVEAKTKEVSKKAQKQAVKKRQHWCCSWQFRCSRFPTSLSTG